jgi:hypothetical protein
MRVVIINVGELMNLVKFNYIQDAEFFLKLYSVSECIINIKSDNEILIWVDQIKDPLEDVLCNHCQKYTDAIGKYCAWCGEPLNEVDKC